MASADGIALELAYFRVARDAADTEQAWRSLARVALAPIANITGRLPTGNTGRADVSAFVAMELSGDFKSILRQRTK